MFGSAKTFEFLRALETGERAPSTPAQRQFVDVCRGRRLPETNFEISWIELKRGIEEGRTGGGPKPFSGPHPTWVAFCRSLDTGQRRPATYTQWRFVTVCRGLQPPESAHEHEWLRLRAVAAVVAERRADAAEPHRQAPEGKIKRPKLSITPDPFAAAREARIRERFGEKAYVRYADEPLGSRAAFARDRASWKRTH